MSKYSRNTVRGIPSVNAELEKIQNAINDQLDRRPDTGVDNQMEADLDMNSNRIYNLGDPVDNKDAVTKEYVDQISIDANAQGVIPVEVGRQTGDGSTTVFTIPTTSDGSQPPARSYLVYLDGVHQKPVTDYNVLGTSITFVEAPEDGVSIDITFYEPAISTEFSANNLHLYTDYVFNSVADMKASLTLGGDTVILNVGDSVKTLGYYSPNDGGGAEYVVVAAATGTDDGGSYHDLDNGLQAELLHNGAVNVKQFGMNGDCTSQVQNAVNNLEISKIIFTKGSYYFAGGANSVLINRNDLELVFESGATLTQDNNGALFWVGQNVSVSNITFTGKGGKIRNPASNHAFETTGILVGSDGNNVDKFTITDMDIYMSKYGLANGSQSVLITNMVVRNNKMVVNFAGWASGADIGQAFEINLPNTVGTNTAIITGNYFKTINHVSSKGDAFKWTNGVINFSNNQCILDGQGQTVSVFSSMLQGSKITDSSFKVINDSGTIEDALQLNNSVGAVWQDLTAIVGATFGGGIQIGNNTDCEFKDLVTNATLRQTAGTTCTDCVLDGLVADQLLLSQATANWNNGAIKNVVTSGQVFITAGDCDIDDISADMGGVALRGLYIRGNQNRANNITIKDNTTVQAVQIEGDNNTLTGLTLKNCHSAWNVVSGTGNTIGRVNFQTPISAFAQNYVDSGTDTAYVHKLFGSITAGPHTFPVPNNPSGETTVEFAVVSSNPVITNFTGAKDKDIVRIVISGASGNLTFDRTNAKLAGGVDFVGNQWDSLTIQYDESSSVWYEVSRSQNS